MMKTEEYIITDHGQFETITCPKRKLTLQVIHTDHIPGSLPETALIVFGRFEGQLNGQSFKAVNAFCILNPDEIEYEPYFIHSVLIATPLRNGIPE